jgi:hypothetical protein
MLKSLEPPKNSEQSPYFITTYRSIIIQVLRKLSEVVRAQLFCFWKRVQINYFYYKGFANDFINDTSD